MRPMGKRLRQHDSARAAWPGGDGREVQQCVLEGSIGR